MATIGEWSQHNSVLWDKVMASSVYCGTASMTTYGSSTNVIFADWNDGAVVERRLRGLALANPAHGAAAPNQAWLDKRVEEMRVRL